MAPIRSPEFWKELVQKGYRQTPNGCWAGGLLPYLHSIGREEWTQETLAGRLGITAQTRDDETRVLKFLKEEIRVPVHQETDCSKNRLIKMSSLLPREVAIYMAVYDERVHFLYQPKDDRAGTHVLMLLDAYRRNGGVRVRVFDAHSVYGGVDDLPWEYFRTIWHEGKNARSHLEKRLTPNLRLANKRWFLAVGVDDEEFYRWVGKPRQRVGRE